MYFSINECTRVRICSSSNDVFISDIDDLFVDIVCSVTLDSGGTLRDFSPLTLCKPSQKSVMVGFAVSCNDSSVFSCSNS